MQMQCLSYEERTQFLILGITRYTGWAQSLSPIRNIYYKKTTWNKNTFFFQNATQLKKFFYN
jgi:hypothetical protein